MDWARMRNFTIGKLDRHWNEKGYFYISCFGRFNCLSAKICSTLNTYTNVIDVFIINNCISCGNWIRIGIYQLFEVVSTKKKKKIQTSISYHQMHYFGLSITLCIESKRFNWIKKVKQSKTVRCTQVNTTIWLWINSKMGDKNFVQIQRFTFEMYKVKMRLHF